MVPESQANLGYLEGIMIVILESSYARIFDTAQLAADPLKCQNASYRQCHEKRARNEQLLRGRMACRLYL
jgi:hypothetical protein